MAAVLHVAAIYRKTGKTITIGLEPEPDCFLETTQDVIEFFGVDLDSEGCRYICEHDGCALDEARGMIRRHLGVCFDTCHLAIQFEDLAQSLINLCRHDIMITKV